MGNKFYLGIDVGGTKIRGVLLSAAKNGYVFAFERRTPKTRKEFLKILIQQTQKIIQGKKIVGIGVGLPGIVDTKRGILVKAPNLGFLNGWQAKKFFLKFRTRTKFDNDSRCFLRAEALIGAGKKHKNIIALTIGTGIGGGIMIKRRIYDGSHNAAGEFGHMIIDDKKSLEQLGAKKAFLKMGDRSKIIGIGVANIINVLDPQIIILGGGGIMKSGVKIEKVRKISKRYIMSPLTKKTPIIKGKLGENAQAVGAALLFK
jgi:glucokinase